MKIRNVSSLPVQVLDEGTGRGSTVPPGGELEVSEQAYRELLDLKHIWEPVESAPVRTSGAKKKGS